MGKTKSTESGYESMETGGKINVEKGENVHGRGAHGRYQ
jgi:hypothetical protein